MRLRDANPADLAVIADLIRALAEYERLTHEIEWTEDELAATLFGPDAVPRVVLAEPTDPPGPAVGLAVWFAGRRRARGVGRPRLERALHRLLRAAGAQPVPGWTRYRWTRNR